MTTIFQVGEQFFSFYSLYAGEIHSFVLAVLYGKIEAVIYDAGFQPDDNNQLFGWLSPSYHLPVTMLWFSMCIVACAPKFFFSFCWAEDLSYFVFSKKDSLDDKDWVNWKLKGFYASTALRAIGLYAGKDKFGYIPNTYVALNLLTVIIYSI